jgi:hypothetical protein
MSSGAIIPASPPNPEDTPLPRKSCSRWRAHVTEIVVLRSDEALDEPALAHVLARALLDRATPHLGRPSQYGSKHNHDGLKSD